MIFQTVSGTFSNNGVLHYASGTGAATVAIPKYGVLTRVSVLAGAANVTVTVGGGPTITVPANAGFDETYGEHLQGIVTNTNVVITGMIKSYYVAWVM